MHQILQACAQRGAFKPDEFKDIGALNDKLKSLLEYAKTLEDNAKDQQSNNDGASSSNQSDNQSGGLSSVNLPTNS